MVMFTKSPLSRMSYKALVLGCFSGLAFLGAGFLISGSVITNNNNASAATDSAETPINIEVNDVISIATGGSIDVSAEPNKFSSASTTLTVSTNSAQGYTMTMSVGGADNTLHHVDATSSSADNTITSLSSDSSAANFPAGKWGYLIGNATNYSPIPSAGSSTTITEAGSTGTETTTVTVGAKPTQTNQSGTYTNSLIFTAITNIPLTPTMQDFVCSNLADGESTQLQDSRDGKMYWVAKLPDNNCWMTQNLEYKLSQGTTLTPADSDVASNWTIPKTTQTAGYDTLGSAAEWTDTDAYSYYPKEDAHVGTEGDYGNDGDTYGVYDYFVNGTTKAHYESDAACASANSTTEEVCAHWRTGIYYNWFAATAGTGTTSISSGNATSSICPKGWKLPTGGSSGQFQTLLGSVSATDIVKAPYYFVRSGYYDSDYAGVYNFGSNGYYWSSTAYGSSTAYYLNFNSSNVNPANTNNKADGYSLRCLSGS